MRPVEQLAHLLGIPESAVTDALGPGMPSPASSGAIEAAPRGPYMVAAGMSNCQICGLVLACDGLRAALVRANDQLCALGLPPVEVC